MKLKSTSFIILIGLLFSTCNKDFEWKNPYDPENILDQSLRITTPNGGDQLELGVLASISWQSQDVSEPIKLELYKGNSAHSIIEESVDNDNRYSWEVPFDIPAASNYKVKIISTANSEVNDLSDSQFTFYMPTINITSPGNGDDWYFGRSMVIEWSSTRVSGGVKVELYKGSNKISVISNSTANDGALSWSIPTNLTAGSDYKIKIISVSNPNVYDYSTSTFTIRTAPIITIQSPNGGNEWLAGSAQNITWSNVGLNHNVDITLYKNDEWYLIIAENTANDGEHNWVVPLTCEQSDSYKIRVRSAYDSKIEDFSDSAFEILWPTFEVTYPNGDEELLTETPINITWNTVDYNEKIWIGLYNQNTFIYEIADELDNTGEYQYIFSTGLVESNQYSIKVASSENHDMGDVSDSYFTIEWPPFITVVYPNGGELWLANSTNTIYWDSHNIDGNVKIQLYKNDSFFSTITSSTPNDRGHSWFIPSNHTIGTDYKIRISSINSSDVEGFSASTFTIREPWDPRITVTYPNGGETLETSNNHSIRWDKHDIDGNVKIELLNNNSLFYILQSNTPNDGSHSWWVDKSFPDNSYYRIRITSLSNSSVNDKSDGNFSIRWRERIDVTYPDGSGIPRGQYLTIRWTSQYVTGLVWIGLYRWEGLVAYVVHQNTGVNVSLGQYTWLFPPFSIPAGTGYRIKVAKGSIIGWSKGFEVY